MLNVIYFCCCLFTKICKASLWDATGHKQNQKAIAVPRGSRNEGEAGWRVGDVSPSHLQDSTRCDVSCCPGGRAAHVKAETLTPRAAASGPACQSLLFNKLLPWKKRKNSFSVFNYLIKFTTLNLIETASRELHLKTDKTFASVLLIIVVARFTLNINGLQLLFKWYGNCYFILKFPLSNKGKD